MWSILKAEIQYSAVIFLVYLAMTIGFTFVERALEDGGRFYVAMLLFLIVQNWLAYKGKEKRDILIARLPKSQMVIGSVRIAMILVSAVIVILVYKSMHLALGIEGHANYPVTGWKLASYIALVLFGFSVYYILSDIFAPRLREKKDFQVIKERLFQFLILIALLLQILGIVALKTKAPNFVTKLFDILYFNNPLDVVRNIQIFMVISVLTAAVSLFTFSRRKNYLQ